VNCGTVLGHRWEQLGDRDGWPACTGLLRLFSGFFMLLKDQIASSLVRAGELAAPLRIFLRNKALRCFRILGAHGRRKLALPTAEISRARSRSGYATAYFVAGTECAQAVEAAGTLGMRIAIL